MFIISYGMKRVFIFILTPLIALVIVVLNIPDWKEAIVNLSPNAEVVVYVLLIVGTIYNYVVTVLSPYLKMQKMKKQRWIEIDDAAQKLREIYLSKDIILSFNIMVVKTSFSERLHPKSLGSRKKKFSLFPKIFKVVWSYGSHVNSKLKFSTKQGSCGHAFKDEDFCAYDLTKFPAKLPKSASGNPGVTLGGPSGTVATSTVSIGEEFNLNDLQIELTRKLTMVASCPIIHRQYLYDYQVVKVVGVLNVESQSVKAVDLVNDESKRLALFEGLESLSRAYLFNHI